MKELDLGPNGALLYSMEYLVRLRCDLPAPGLRLRWRRGRAAEAQLRNYVYLSLRAACGGG